MGKTSKTSESIESRLMSSADKKIEQCRQEIRQNQQTVEKDAVMEYAITGILNMLADKGFTIKEARDVLLYTDRRAEQIISKLTDETKFADTVEHWYAHPNACQCD